MSSQRQPQLSSSLRKRSAASMRARGTVRHSRFAVLGGIHHPGSVIGAGSEAQVARDEAIVAMSAAAGNTAAADTGCSPGAPAKDARGSSEACAVWQQLQQSPVPRTSSARGNRTPVEAWSRSARHSRFSVVGGIHHPASVPGVSVDAHLRRDEATLAQAFVRVEETVVRAVKNTRSAPFSQSEGGVSSPAAAVQDLDTTEDGAAWKAATLALISHDGQSNKEAACVAQYLTTPAPTAASTLDKPSTSIAARALDRAASTGQLDSPTPTASWDPHMLIAMLFLLLSIALGGVALVAPQ